MASRENIPHTVKVEQAWFSHEFSEERKSSCCLWCAACHSHKIPTNICCRGVFVQWCYHGMVTERGEDTPSAMLCVSDLLRKGATFRSDVHVTDGKSWRNPCLKEWSNRGWVIWGGIVDKAAGAVEMRAGCSCNALYCTAALKLTSSRAQLSRCPLTSL